MMEQTQMWPSDSVQIVELDEVDRQIVLACKHHYDHISDVPMYVLRKIYYKFFYKKQSLTVADSVIIDRMLRLIHRYGLFRNEYQFSSLIWDMLNGPSYELLFNKKPPKQIVRVYRSLISFISRWQVHNREDHIQYELGEADLW